MSYLATSQEKLIRRVLYRSEAAMRHNGPGAKEQENQSRSKDRYLSVSELKSLQTKQLTTGESCSRWSYTFRNNLRVALAAAATRAIPPTGAIY
jgi:hypothetical protein